LPGYTVIFYDNRACENTLAEIEPELGQFFNAEKQGMLKADMCRLGQLWQHGGLYFDIDIVPVVNLHKHVHRQTTFATVRSTGEIINNLGFFQAFLGAAPNHPVIAAALQTTLTYYRALAKRDLQKMSDMMAGFPTQNIGTALLIHAFSYYSKVAANTTVGPLSPDLKQSQTMMHDDGHISQIFLESSFSALDETWNTNQIIVGRDRSSNQKQPPHCEYVVVDRDTKTVVFYSRSFAGVEDQFCLVSWTVLPPQALPNLTGTSIPKIIHVIGDNNLILGEGSTSGTHKEWILANPQFAVKLWTRPEIEYYIKHNYLHEHYPVSPLSSLWAKLSFADIKTLFAHAIMYKYGGILVTPSEWGDVISVSQWHEHLSAGKSPSSYCLMDRKRHQFYGVAAVPQEGTFKQSVMMFAMHLKTMESSDDLHGVPLDSASEKINAICDSSKIVITPDSIRKYQRNTVTSSKSMDSFVMDNQVASGAICICCICVFLKGRNAATAALKMFLSRSAGFWPGRMRQVD